MLKSQREKFSIIKMSLKQSVYPVLASAPTQDVIDPVMAGNYFRMNKVDEFQKYIRDEQLRYRKSYKKMKRACLGLKYAEYGCHFVDAVLKGFTVAVPVLLPVSVPISLSLNGTTIAISITKGFLSTKRQKFLQILTLCTSKLDSITQHINKAINDGIISQEEFEMIHQEVINYDKLKNKMEEKFSKEVEEIQLTKDLEKRIYELGRTKGREEKTKEVISRLNV
jgi:hypothetical protein